MKREFLVYGTVGTANSFHEPLVYSTSSFYHDRQEITRTALSLDYLVVHYKMNYSVTGERFPQRFSTIFDQMPTPAVLPEDKRIVTPPCNRSQLFFRSNIVCFISCSINRPLLSVTTIAGSSL